MPPDTLYHYTPASAVDSIIQKDLKTKLYATHSRYLNDHNELDTGILHIKDIIKNRPEILELSEDQINSLKGYLRSGSQFNHFWQT